jgi:cbb3-type cytochrome oxidase maturation protein
MDILFLLIPLSLLLVFAIIYAIWWAVDRGQFENIEKYGDEILHDDDSVHAETKQ